MEPPHSDSAHGHPFRHSPFPQLLPTTDTSSLQAQRFLSSFVYCIDRDKVEKALAQGELYQGLLRINAKKPIDAFVTCDALGSDVFVCNARTRHRALEGYLVAIQHPA
ncbi:hypothetical protein DM01DRAFT_1347234 [Hesseltinella vesiculosa]|uniref:Uncharacterized protein n=1 Tax=Hesseltinella vesiculosa TaxID=101127 RepID=A0A1X2GCW0_9FUNG|nr:hypothetical protein DM01DRAFT_1347234 [Hesseltinella vesiculosa]